MSATSPLIVIPARGGSKGIPGKNLRLVGGLSLIARAVGTARRACALMGGGRVIVDSDDDAIRDEGRRWGAESPYRRPAKLASDTAGSLAVLAHALRTLGVGADDPRPIVLMQATSPFTPAEHVVEAVTLWRQANAPVVSVAACDHPPEWAFALDGAGRLVARNGTAIAARRQDLQPAFQLTGAVYVGAAGDLLAGRDFVMPGRTHTVRLDTAAAIDIDTPADLAVADAIARSAEPPPVRIGQRAIGAGERCFIIAEAGVNHDGEVAEAHRLVDAAADIGADAVKFQTWRTQLIAKPGVRKAAYQEANGAAGEDQFTMLKRLELPYAAYRELADHARERGLVFLSTPDEIESARFLAELGVPLIKIGSGELDNLPYLAQIGPLGRPVLLSTGMGTLPEVAAALDAIGAGTPVALLHAVSAYPAPASEANLRAIATMRAAFGVPVGLSDHFVGPEVALAAVGIGLPVWEKHLTRDRARSGPDHAASLDPDGFARQIALVRSAEAALGDGDKRLQASEIDTVAVVRKRLHAARALPAGHVVRLDDLIALRSDRGLPASAWRSVVDRPLARAIAALQAFAESDMEAR